MVNKRIIILFFFVLLYTCLGNTNVLAMNTGFSTQNMTEENQKTFISNIKLVKEESAPTQTGILCFDVNEDGLIAIGKKGFSRKSVSVYNSSGEYKYSYSFDYEAGFGVEWDGNNLIIYFERSDVAALVDEDGTVLELQEIENTIDNSSYWNNSVFLTQRTVGDHKYVIKNDMGFFNIFASSYSQFITVDDQGNQKILHDVNSMQLTRTIIAFVAVVVFVAIGIYVLRLEFIKLRKK